MQAQRKRENKKKNCMHRYCVEAEKKNEMETVEWVHKAAGLEAAGHVW